RAALDLARGRRHPRGTSPCRTAELRAARERHLRGDAGTAARVTPRASVPRAPRGAPRRHAAVGSAPPTEAGTALIASFHPQFPRARAAESCYAASATRFT